MVARMVMRGSGITMKQVSFYLRDIAGFDAWARQFRETCPWETKTVFVSVFSGWPDKAALGELVHRLKKMLPNAVIVGSTTAGEIMSGYLSEKTAILNFMFFQKTDVRLLAIDFSDTPPEEAAASLLESLREEEVAGVGLFVAQNDALTHRFLSHLRPLAPHIKVFGGIAGNTEEFGSYVFTGERALERGVAAVCFLGGELRIQVSTSVGWRPLGPSFRITKMAGGNVIRELDGNPAQNIYQKYLGLSRADINGRNLLFPLCVERNGNLIMRLPIDCTEDGALTIAGDCREGECVRLAYGDPSRILDASYNSRIDIMSFEPEAILLSNCVTRRIFLREDTNQELRPFQSIAPNAGLYVNGEISRDDDGNVLLLNMSLVAASFREGPQGESSSSAISLEPRTRKLTDMMKLVQCLANFVAVVSAESEMVNEQLAQLARTDRLTGLYNRGEIESVLREALMRNRKDDGVLSAIMIDLDNFKSVNDTFGHAVGDDTLRWTAKVIQGEIRGNDAAGRWGGEEFFVVLPYTTVEAAKSVAERIRRALDKGHTLPDGRSVTGSFGVARFPESGDYMKFYQYLDEALYRAKQAGKNCVCVAEEEGRSE